MLSNKAFQFIGVGVLVLFASLFLNPRASIAADDVIKIGQVEPLSGALSYFGKQFKVGVAFAIKEQNAKGGLFGKKIVHITRDSGMDSALATRRAKELIRDDKVDFMAGGSPSNIGVPVNKVCATYKKILVSMGTVKENLRGKDFSKYCFYAYFSNYAYVNVFAHAIARMPYKKIYIFAQDYSWGHEFEKTVKERLPKLNPQVHIVGSDFHPFGQKDYAPYLSKIKKQKPELMLIGSLGTDLMNIIKQFHEFGLELPKLAAFCNENVALSNVGNLALGDYSPVDYSLFLDNPENKEMIKRYREYRKDDKDTLTMLPYGNIGRAIVGMQFFFAAVEKAGSLDTEKIINSWEGMHFKSAYGDAYMRACDHQMMTQWHLARVVKENPFYDFPTLGPPIATFSPEEVNDPKPDNPRCK